MYTRRLVLVSLIAVTCVGRSLAHALPDTAIRISAHGGVLRIAITVPVPELLLALRLGNDLDLLVKTRQAELQRYFSDHLLIQATNEVALPYVFTGITMAIADGDHVGDYQVIRVGLTLPAVAVFTLKYDAILHQVPSHAATVVWVGPDGGTSDIGVLSYDFVGKSVAPLEVRLPI